MVIAVSNNKGGVGKTTSTVNIGAGLARVGKKVLLIDLDPQANLTQHLGIKEPESTISDVLQGDKKLGRVIIPVLDNLSVVASEKALNNTARILDTELGRELKLKGFLKTVRQNYDYVFIDCMPALNVLTHNALTAANEVYIPMQSQFLALYGLNALTEEIDTIKESLNKRLKIGGIIITQYDGRTILNRDILKSITDNYGDVVFSHPVRSSIALAEAPAMGQDIFTYAPESNGAKDYEFIVNEFLKKY